MQAFQLGTTAGQQPILQEANKLIKYLRKEGSEAFDPGTVLQLATANVICSFVCGHQFDYNDLHITKLIEYMRAAVTSISYRSIGLFFPKISKAPIVGVQAFFDCVDLLKEQQRANINDHLKTLDRNNPRDFIDHYLIEMEKNGQADGFTMDNLEVILVDLFMAGTETSAGVIYWCLLMLLRRPDIQTKIQQELDRVIPAEQEFVTMEDQSRCLYTQAVIYETLRFSSIAPSAMRQCTADVQLGQYRVPEGTYVMAAYMNTHFSQKLWDRPKEFRPERFLSQKEPVKLIKQDFMFAFSTGKYRRRSSKLKNDGDAVYFYGVQQPITKLCQFCIVPRRGVHINLCNCCI